MKKFLILAAVLLVGCAATVPKKVYDEDLQIASGEIESLKTELNILSEIELRHKEQFAKSEKKLLEAISPILSGMAQALGQGADQTVSVIVKETTFFDNFNGATVRLLVVGEHKKIKVYFTLHRFPKGDLWIPGTMTWVTPAGLPLPEVPEAKGERL
jgi:hypothetical protein